MHHEHRDKLFLPHLKYCDSIDSDKQQEDTSADTYGLVGNAVCVAGLINES